MPQITQNMIILLNNQHYANISSGDLIDTLTDMMERKIYVPTRDIIEIISETEWLKRRPLPRPRI